MSVVLSGTKQPHWGCSCGASDNWASRTACRLCGRGAPARIRKAAEKAHAANASRGPPPAAPAAKPQGARARGSDGFEPVLSKRQKRAKIKAAKKLLAAEGLWTPPPRPALAQSGPAVATTSTADETSMQVEMDEGGEQLGAEIKQLKGEIKQLKGDISFYESMDADRRERFCAHLGGYEAAVAKLRTALQECCAKQRGCKPLRQQLASAQSREDSLAKSAKAEADKLEEMREQLTLLQSSIVSQQAKAEKAAADLVTAKAEVSRLAAERAAETGGQGTLPTPTASSEGSAHVLTLDLANVEGTPQLAAAYNVLVNAKGAIRISGAATAEGQPAAGGAAAAAPTFLSPAQSLLHAAAAAHARDMLGPDFWLEAAQQLEEDDAASVAESTPGDLPSDPAEKEKALLEQAAQAKTKAAEKEKDKAKRLKVNATKLSQAFEKRRCTRAGGQA